MFFLLSKFSSASEKHYSGCIVIYVLQYVLNKLSEHCNLIFRSVHCNLILRRANKATNSDNCLLKLFEEVKF